MPVHNGARYLLAAVDSVLAQTHTDFEFIIIDDASQDETPALLAQLTDPRIRVITNGRNLGIAASLNHALSVATGRYIARMDADDLCMPERFARQVAFLDQHPNVGVVGTGAEVIDETGASRGNTHPLVLTDGAIRWLNFFGNPFIHPTVMMRRDVLVAVGGYDTAFVSAQDRDLWDRLLGITQGANLPDILLKQRIHSHNVSVTRSREQMANVVKVGQRACAALLGKEIDFQQCMALATSSVQSASEAAVITALLTQIYRTFTLKQPLLPGEERFVRWEYAHRLFRMARQWPSDPRMWRVMGVAAVAEPTLILDWVAKRMGRERDLWANMQKSP